MIKTRAFIVLFALTHGACIDLGPDPRDPIEPTIPAAFKPTGCTAELTVTRAAGVCTATITVDYFGCDAPVQKYDYTEISVGTDAGIATREAAYTCDQTLTRAFTVPCNQPVFALVIGEDALTSQAFSCGAGALSADDLPAVGR